MVRSRKLDVNKILMLMFLCIVADNKVYFVACFVTLRHLQKRVDVCLGCF